MKNDNNENEALMKKLERSVEDSPDYLKSMIDTLQWQNSEILLRTAEISRKLEQISNELYKKPSLWSRLTRIFS